MKKAIQTISKNSHLIVLGAIVVYFAIFSYIGIWKYQNFQYNAMDLAIINQTFFSSAQGNFFASSIHPPSYLGDHFTPILFLLLPIYALFKNPQTLILLQTLALALSAWPLYVISKKITGRNWAMFISLAWLLNPLVQNINLFEFHFLAFAPFFIFWAFYFYQNKKFLPFLLLGSLALLVREDVALVFIIFGLLALLDKRSMKWWLTPVILSVAYFIFAIMVSSWAAPSEQYKFLLYYSWLGGSWLEIIKNILFHPWIVLPKIFSLGSLIVAFGLLLPSSFLPLLKPKYLLLSSLIYLQLVMGAGWNWLATILFTQYSSLLLPGVFISAIFGVEHLGKISFKNKSLQLVFQEKKLVGMAIILALLYSTLSLGPLPGSLLKIAKNGPKTHETRVKQQLLSQIPEQASVAATYEFLTTLSSRNNLASLNYAFLGKLQFLSDDYALPEETEYLLIDFQDLVTYQLQYYKNSFYHEQYTQAVKQWPTLLENFGLIEVKNSFGLYQKGQKNKYTLIKTFDQPPEIAFAGNNLGDSSLKFLGHNKIDNALQLFWEQNSVIDKNYYIKLSVSDEKKIVYEKILPLGYGLLRSDELKDAKIIQTNYWFELKNILPSGNYKLSLDLTEIVRGGVKVTPLRATENIIDSELIIISKFLEEDFTL